jgi:TonB family protein
MNAWRKCLVGLLALAIPLSPVRASAQAGGGAAAPGPRVIVAPKLVKFVEAEFPPSEVAAGKGATVVLQIGIDVTGKVASLAVTESAGPAFDAAAVAAVKQFEFEPATANGTPIPVKITYRYQFTITEKLVKKQTADFQGTVLERGTKKPLADIRVAVDTGQEAVTDEQGKFRIPDIAPGEHAVTLSGEAIATVGTSEQFEASKNVDATYEVEKKKQKSGGSDEEEEEVVITAPRIKKQVISTEVQATQATRVPGTQGDVLKVVENLPGVARAAVGSGALIVWGSAPQDTRVYVEGVHVPRLYHDGGYRSIVSSELVKSVELIPGGYGPTYGRGLGGLVTVALRPLDDEGMHGSVAADVIDASAAARAKISDRVHVAVAARKSYLDSVLSAVTSQDVGAFVPIPSYWDGQARITYDLAPHETLEVGGLISSDRTTRTVLNPNPALTTRQTTGTDFNRIYVRYEKHLPDSSVVSVVPFLGTDSTSLVNLYGSTPTEVTNDSAIYGVRAGWRGPVQKYLRVSIGIDAEMQVASLHRSGSIGAPPREGDVYVFGEPPPAQINSDDWKAVIATVAPYVEGDFSLLDDTLHVTPGARFEPFITSANKVVAPPPGAPNVGFTREEPAIEPRVNVRYAFTPTISGKAAFGIYHQAPQAEELSAVFGTPTLVLSTARHYLAGAVFQLTQTLSAETTAFYSESDDLVVRSQSLSPLAGHALDQTGIGHSYGAQFLLRQQQVGHFFGWVSYSILHSERRDAPDIAWRLFDYDQTHIFTALGSYDLGAGFEVGARFRYATGYPRTPVIGSYFDATTQSYQPIFGLHNSIRIPPFVSVDVRFAKRFKILKTDAEAYLDVQNVTDHANPEEIVYNTSFTQRGYITGLPILPVLGLRWSW